MKEKVIKIIKKVFEVLKLIFCIVFFGITTIFIMDEKRNKKIAEQIKKDKENEIKNKNPDDIIADSPNQPDIQSDIAETKEEFRKRVRNRLNQNL